MQIPVLYPPEQLDYTRRVLGQRPYDEVRAIIATMEQAVAAFNAQQKAQQPAAQPAARKRGRPATAKVALQAPQTVHNGAAVAS